MAEIALLSRDDEQTLVNDANPGGSGSRQRENALANHGGPNNWARTQFTVMLALASHRGQAELAIFKYINGFLNLRAHLPHWPGSNANPGTFCSLWRLRAQSVNSVFTPRVLAAKNAAEVSLFMLRHSEQICHQQRYLELWLPLFWVWRHFTKLRDQTPG